MVGWERHLSKGTFSHTSEEDEVEEVDISIKVNNLVEDGEKMERMRRGERTHLWTTAEGAHGDR
jgi:hypothetical protein